MAKRRRIQLQHLIGREVHDSRGARVGHIEEIRATNISEGCFVQEYLLGREGLALRLSIPHFANLIVRNFGAQNQPVTKHVPWQQMNLSDPKRPTLRCTKEELEGMQPQN